MNDNSNENEDLTITLDRGQTLFLAHKTEKHPDKFVTVIGVFTTYEAADQACTDDGEEEFCPPYTFTPLARSRATDERRPNKNFFYYDVTEVSLVK